MVLRETRFAMFDEILALPRVSSNSGTEIAIFLERCCKTKTTDDTSSEILMFFEKSGCGCKEEHAFSGDFGGVTLGAPLALQWQAFPGFQVAFSVFRFFSGLEAPDAPKAPSAPKTPTHF